jgi:hypothetical protein
MIYYTTYDMIYDMIHLFTAVGFPPSGRGRQTGTGIGERQLYIQKEKQYTKQHGKTKYTK